MVKFTFVKEKLRTQKEREPNIVVDLHPSEVQDYIKDLKGYELPDNIYPFLNDCQKEYWSKGWRGCYIIMNYMYDK